MKYFEICGVSKFGEDDLTVLVKAQSMPAALETFLTEYPGFTVRLAAESEISEVLDPNAGGKDK